MNLCSAWIDVKGSYRPQMQKTLDPLASCTGDFLRYKNLQDFWAGKAQTLLQSWTHTKYFKDGGDKTLDHISGVQDWLNLAAGFHKPKKQPNGKTPCADDDGDPPVCEPVLVPDNADTLAIVAGAKWFSDKAQCNREIPIDQTPVQPPAVDNSERRSCANAHTTARFHCNGRRPQQRCLHPAVYTSEAISGAV